MMHKPRKRELSILLTVHCLDKIHIHVFMNLVTIFLKVQKLWPINNILPRTDNSTVKNQGLSFLFIPHGLDEIYLSGIFP